MDKQVVRKLLQGRCTAQSRWEFVNFILETYGDYQGRAAMAVLARRRAIADMLDDMALDSAGQLTLKTELEAEAGQLDQWLDQFSEAELAEMLDGIEANEQDYWVERLGREAAVDLFISQRVSKDVMFKAVLLPEEQFRKFIEICGNIGHTINTVSQEVEQAQGYAVLPEGQPK